MSSGFAIVFILCIGSARATNFLLIHGQGLIDASCTSDVAGASICMDFLPSWYDVPLSPRCTSDNMRLPEHAHPWSSCRYFALIRESALRK